MKVLVIAYEYPPIESAHGLRWGYLARELVRQGHDVCVITSDLLADEHKAVGTDEIRTVRVFAGAMMGTASRLSRWLRRRRGRTTGVATQPVGSRLTFLEWAYRCVRAAGNQLLVPDIRTEWLPWGYRAACAEVRRQRPDLIIVSHEPGVDLAIGARLHNAFGIPVLADVGDPVVGFHTPRWRRWVDAYFEKKWLSHVQGVTVTTDATRQLLQERVPHLRCIPVEVLTQGFDLLPASDSSPVEFDDGRLELLYTGTLYLRFRSPRPLLDALSRVEGVRLTVIGSLDGIDPVEFSGHPAVRYLGRLPHEAVRAAQRRAHVLVNVGNDLDAQVPGKLFEYFGACRPILHLDNSPADPSGALLEELRRGRRVAANDGDGIVKVLRELRNSGDGFPQFQLRLDTVEPYSWTGIASRLETLMHRVVEASGERSGAAACKNPESPGC